MANRVDIIVGVTENATGKISAATTIIDQFNSNKTGFELVNQSAQTGAAIANVTSIVRATAGFIPFLNATTNTFAGSTAFLKITADYHYGRDISINDVISLVGNTMGVALSFTALAMGGPVTGVLAAMAVVSNVTSILTSQVAENMFRETVLPIWNNYFKDSPSATYETCWIAPNLTLVNPEEIQHVFNGKIAMCTVNPQTGEVLNGETAIDFDTLEVGGSTTGGGGGSSGGGGGSGYYPYYPPIWIPYPNDPVGTVHVGDPQMVNSDTYNCCSVSSDSYK